MSPSTISEIVTKMPQNYIPVAETISEFNYLYNLGYKVIKFFPATLNDGCKKLRSIETIYTPEQSLNNVNKLLSSIKDDRLYPAIKYYIIKDFAFYESGLCKSLKNHF